MNEKKLLKVARLALRELVTLKDREGDALEYVEVNLLGFKEAIRTSYELGLRDGKIARDR